LKLLQYWLNVGTYVAISLGQAFDLILKLKSEE